MPVLRDARSINVPVDGKTSLALGRGFDEFTSVFRGNSVQPTPTTPAGGSETTFSMQLITSARDLRMSLAGSASARFSTILGTSVDARVAFMTSSEVNQYYAYLLVRCSVVTSGQQLASFAFTSEAQQQIGNVPDFYLAYGDLFCEAMWWGGELLGLITFATESEASQSAVEGSIKVAQGTWQAAADFEAAMGEVTENVNTSVHVYSSPSFTPIPTTIPDLVTAAANFPATVKAGQAAPCEFQAVDYGIVPSNPIFEGPQIDSALRALGRYAAANEQLLDVQNDLAYIGAHPSAFSSFTSAELTQLEQQAEQLGADIDDGVVLLKGDVLNASPRAGVDVVQRAAALAEQVPLRGTKTSWSLASVAQLPGKPTSADGPGLGAVDDVLVCAYRGNTSAPDQDQGTTDLSLSTLADDGGPTDWTQPQKLGNPDDSNKYLSASGPRLVDYDDALWCVHRGSGDDNLWYTQGDGDSWSTDAQLSSSEHLSQCSPALAVFGDGLYCVHRGNQGDPDQRLYVTMLSSPGASWTKDVLLLPNGSDDSTNGYRSAAAPALATFNGVLYSVFRGATDGQTDNQHLYWTSLAAAGGSWTKPLLLPDPDSASVTGPALVEASGSLLCIYCGSGTDPRLHYAVLGLDGHWSQDFLLSTSVGSTRPPALAVFEVSGVPLIYAAWRGAGADSNLYYGLVQ